MIKLLKEGTYTLIETKHHNKILTLDQKKPFVWIMAEKIGEILIVSYVPHNIDHILAAGKYRLYDVNDEPELTDLLHLELHAGNGMWQGYLLPLGLPDDETKRHRIIPTKEIITKTMN